MINYALDLGAAMSKAYFDATVSAYESLYEKMWQAQPLAPLSEMQSSSAQSSGRENDDSPYDEAQGLTPPQAVDRIEAILDGMRQDNTKRLLTAEQIFDHVYRWLGLERVTKGNRSDLAIKDIARGELNGNPAVLVTQAKGQVTAHQVQYFLRSDIVKAEELPDSPAEEDPKPDFKAKVLKKEDCEDGSGDFSYKSGLVSYQMYGGLDEKNDQIDESDL